MTRFPYHIASFLVAFVQVVGFSPEAAGAAGGSAAVDPPVVHFVTYAPDVVRPGDAVTVTAFVVDDSPGDDAVFLSWHVNGEPQEDISMTVSADTVFQGLLPPAAAGDEVAFHVVAMDGFSGDTTRSETFRYTVGNGTPFVVQAITPPVITLGTPPLIFDLSRVFADPDGDPLVFEVASSEERILIASLSAGYLLVLSPVAEATATVTVTATDPFGARAALSFDVTVNASPLVRPIPDTVLTVSEVPWRFDLKDVFVDSAGDSITLTAASNRPDLADVAVVQNRYLEVHLVSPPSSEPQPVVFVVSVLADDGRGGAVGTSFEVEINHRPDATEPLPALTYEVERSGPGPDTTSIGTDELDLDAFFADRDGDALRYAVHSLDTSVVRVDVTDRSLLTVQARAVDLTGRVARATCDDLSVDSTGTTQVAVLAYDGRGGRSEKAYLAVSVSTRMTLGACPTLNLASETDPSAPPAVEHREETIAARVSDASGLESVVLHYRKGGDEPFVSIPMAGVAGDPERLAAVIQASDVTGRGIEFYVTAREAAFARSVRAPAPGNVYFRAVHVPNQGLISTQPLRDGVFHLFAVPLDLDAPGAFDVLEDDLGPYDPRDWRLFSAEQPPGETDPIFSEATRETPLTPGRAYWLIARDPPSFITTGAGTSFPTNEPFRIPLSEGWNLVGNPFYLSVPVAGLSLSSGRPLPLVRSYVESWNDEPIASMEPFTGYALNVDAADTLILDPMAPLEPGITPVVESPPVPVWAIAIRARSNQASDRDNVALVTAGAVRTRDVLDRAEPPPIGTYVSVYFPHPEWESATQRFHTDARPDPEGGDVWPLEVRANTGEPVVLTFEGLDAVPDAMGVWLEDETAGVAQDLRASAVYTMAGVGEATPRRLRLIVGDAAFRERHRDVEEEVPVAFELEQNYPNPFNPATTIAFRLPGAESVTMAVYNALGERVTTLIGGDRKEAGRHSVVWDGRNDAGMPVASGVYFIRIQAGPHTATRKAVLAK